MTGNIRYFLLLVHARNQASRPLVLLSYNYTSVSSRFKLLCAHIIDKAITDLWQMLLGRETRQVHGEKYYI